MKKLIGEFKEFISRGNVIDLAVGVIIGGAFQAIVTALIDDLLMPFIGLLTGGIDFANQFIILKAPEGVDPTAIKTCAEALEQGCNVWQYGAFIAAVINFLIMAIVVFLIVKAINSVSNKFNKKEEEAPTTKVCPFCKEEINIEATICPHCQSKQVEVAEKAE